MSTGNHRGLLPEEARLEDYLAQSDRGEIAVSPILTPPATISVRGYGRYILRAFDGETKKGRLRLRADQLV